MAVQGKVWNLAPTPRQQLEAADMDFAWVSGSGLRALSVGSAGVGLFAGEAARIEAWSNVASLETPAKQQLAISLQSSDDPLEFTFARAKERDEFLASVPPEERERLRANEAPTSGRVHRPAAPSSASATSSLGSIWTLLWCGVIAQIIGGVALGLSWPTLELDDLGVTSADGSGLGLALGWALIGGGSLATLTGVIALGVRLGIRAAAED